MATLTPTKSVALENTLTATTSELAALDPASAGLTDVEQKRAREVVATFYDDLHDVSTNKTQRRQASFEADADLCSFDNDLAGALSVSDLENDSGTAKKLARRTEFSAKLVNERLGGDVPIPKIEAARTKVDSLSAYTPLLGSYNQLSTAACVADQKRTNESLRQFYLASMMFGVDAALVTSGAFYKPAFRATGFTANKLRQVGLYRLRYVCGNSCTALGMSELHWAMRAKMVGVASYTVKRGSELAINFSEGDLQTVAEEQDVSLDRLVDGNLTGCASNKWDDLKSAAKNVSGDEATGYLDRAKESDIEVDLSDAVEQSRDAVDCEETTPESSNDDGGFELPWG